MFNSSLMCYLLAQCYLHQKNVLFHMVSKFVKQHLSYLVDWQLKDDW